MPQDLVNGYSSDELYSLKKDDGSEYTWDEVYNAHKDAGYDDNQIYNKFENSKWAQNPNSVYNKFANGYREQMANQNNANANANAAVTPNMSAQPTSTVPEQPVPIDKDTRKKQLRDQYSTDNKTFKEMAEKEGIEFAAKSAMKTPMQAYLNGDISKDERDYLIFDAIQTAMSNAGNSLLNIAAAYTGGSGNFNTAQKSMWQDRMAGVNEAQTSALQRGVEGSAQSAEAIKQGQDIRKTDYQLLPADAMAKIAQDKNNPGWLRGVAMSMTADFAGNDQDLKDTIVTAIANSKDEISKAAKAEGISEMEYLTRELSKLGTGFVGDVLEGLGENVGKPLKAGVENLAGQAKDAKNDIVYGKKAEENISSVTPEQAERISQILKSSGLQGATADELNEAYSNFQKANPGRQLNPNEVAMALALNRAKELGAKISPDDEADWVIKARKAKDSEMEKLVNKMMLKTYK